VRRQSSAWSPPPRRRPSRRNRRGNGLQALLRRFRPITLRPISSFHLGENADLLRTEAINIPSNIRIFQNNHDSEARGDVIPIRLNAASNEGLFDMITDTVRQRLYIANSGMNRVEVFDLRTKRLLAPIKVGQLPHSLAFATDGITMYVANSGGETISIVDLDRGAQTGLVRFSPLPFNSNVALVTPSLIASGLRGPQVVMSNGRLWRVVGNQVLPRTLNTAVFGNLQTLPGPQTMASERWRRVHLSARRRGTGYLTTHRSTNG